jgi:hypothetical protein
MIKIYLILVTSVTIVIIAFFALFIKLVYTSLSNEGYERPKIESYRPQEGMVQWDYKTCVQSFVDFYKEFGNYHYEGAVDNIVIDFEFQNPEEEGSQYCDYFFGRI